MSPHQLCDVTPVIRVNDAKRIGLGIVNNCRSKWFHGSPSIIIHIRRGSKLTLSKYILENISSTVVTVMKILNYYIVAKYKWITMMFEHFVRTESARAIMNAVWMRYLDDGTLFTKHPSDLQYRKLLFRVPRTTVYEYIDSNETWNWIYM